MTALTDDKRNISYTATGVATQICPRLREFAPADKGGIMQPMTIFLAISVEGFFTLTTLEEARNMQGQRSSN